MHTFEEFEDLLASNEKYRITYLKEAVSDEIIRFILFSLLLISIT